MTMTQDSGGGGGGTTGNHNTGGVTTGSTMGVCYPDPSDLVGTINNLITRIANLETELAQMKLSNTTATQLSDYTPDAGVLDQVIAMLAGSGWVTEGTFTGVAISSLGWPFYNACTGEYENWPIVAVQDGALQFGLSETGMACGQQVEAWNAAASNTGVLMDYASIGYSTNGTHVNQAISRGITITLNTHAFATADMKVQVSQAGVYWVHAHASANSATGHQGCFITVFKNTSAVLGSASQGDPSATVFDATSCGGVFVLAANDIIEATNLTGLGGQIIESGLTVVRISS